MWIILWYTSFRWNPPWTRALIIRYKCMCLPQNYNVHWVADVYIYTHIYIFIYIYVWRGLHPWVVTWCVCLRWIRWSSISESHIYIIDYKTHSFVYKHIQALYPPCCGLTWVAALASQARLAPAIRDLGCVRQIGWEWWPLYYTWVENWIYIYIYISNTRACVHMQPCAWLVYACICICAKLPFFGLKKTTK